MKYDPDFEPWDTFDKNQATRNMELVGTCVNITTTAMNTFTGYVLYIIEDGNILALLAEMNLPVAFLILSLTSDGGSSLGPSMVEMSIVLRWNGVFAFRKIALSSVMSVSLGLV